MHRAAARAWETEGLYFDVGLRQALVSMRRSAVQENKRYVPLRPEARPVEYSKLDESQQKAFDRLVGMLAASMEELRTWDGLKRTTLAAQRLQAPPAWLDDRVKSRIAFLSGDRGTGKTTVLLSLIHACMGAEPPHPQVAGLEDLRGRVVLLEPIDMARFPGPASANLLAQVLARIEDAIQPFPFAATTEHGGLEARREPRGMLGRYPKGLDPLLTLQRLQTAVATAFDGNLSEHREELDSDDYAVETMRAERERMMFSVKLSEALDALAALVPGTSPVGPLFLVSLDDVDLNPLRCLEALKLLHLLSVRRVFIVVLGDMDMVEIALHLKHSGDFSSLAGHGAPLNPISMLARDVARRVGQLSASTMRKLLPPAQRIRLQSLTRADALYLRPIGPESGERPTLGTLLHFCPAAITTDDPPRMGERVVYSIRDFLLYPVPAALIDASKVKEDQLKVCTYKASQILCMPPRWAVDWWQFLNDVADRHPWFPPERPEEKRVESEKRDVKWRDVINLLGRHCHSMIDEDPTLTPEDRRAFREGFRRSPRPASGSCPFPCVPRRNWALGPDSPCLIKSRSPGASCCRPVMAGACNTGTRTGAL
jgi:hypothetical protein